MFGFAYVIGVYSYSIFFLGIFGLLYPQLIIGFTAIFTIILAIFFKIDLNSFFKKILSFLKKKQDKLFYVLCIFFVAQAIVNIIGVFGPEIGFDALWYHLTLPKLYMLDHKIDYITGGLLYYSVMPQLTEMLYIPFLLLLQETGSKLVHFSFGLLTAFSVYCISRRFFSPTISLLAVVIFYSNLVVAWESTTAYVDLARAFFETLAVWAFIIWLETKGTKWILHAALLLGFAISIKLLSLGSLLIFLILISFTFLKNVQQTKMIFVTFLFLILAMLVASPWFLYAYSHTGNPIYPFFTQVYPVTIESSIINITRFALDLIKLSVQSNDPISPIYILFSPLILLYWKQIDKKLYPILFYCILSVIIWYITPRPGDGRFILPYLSVFSIAAAGIFDTIKLKFLKVFCLYLVLFISSVSIGYRFLANVKFIPVILGKQTKEDFLVHNLRFSYGDFYDVKNSIKKIVNNDVVLLYGFHNLYYVDFSFIDSSWVEKGNRFMYVATQNTLRPERFKNWKLVYFEPKTQVKLYISDIGKKEWVY